MHTAMHCASITPSQPCALLHPQAWSFAKLGHWDESLMSAVAGAPQR